MELIIYINSPDIPPSFYLIRGSVKRQLTSVSPLGGTLE